MSEQKPESRIESEQTAEPGDESPVEKEDRPPEYGGPRGKEPTRYGDWEKKGRCIDF